MVGLGIVLLVLAMYLFYAHGKRVQAGIDAGKAYSADSTTRAKATMDAVRATAPVKAEIAKLHAVVDSLETKAIPLVRAEAERKTAASLIRSRLTLHINTATLHTDTGDVAYRLPIAITEQFAAERATMDSAFNAMEHREANDSSTIHYLTGERDGQTVEIQLDSVVVLRLRSEIALRDSTIATLRKQSAPRFTFTEGAVLGTTLTVATRILVAILTHR